MFRIKFIQSLADYLYYSTIFDGSNDYLTRDGDLTGGANSKQGTISVFVKSASDVADGGIMGSHDVFSVRIAGGELFIDAFNASITQIMRLRATVPILVADGWVHILASWDLSDTGKRHVYINGVDVTNPIIYTDDTIAYSSDNWNIGARGDTFGRLDGMLSELYFNNTYLDLSIEANRLKFRGADGKPVYLGANGELPTGTTPLIYLRNQVPGWHVNLGSGGGFTEHGTLVDGGDDKPGRTNFVVDGWQTFEGGTLDQTTLEANDNNATATWGVNGVSKDTHANAEKATLSLINAVADSGGLGTRRDHDLGTGTITLDLNAYPDTQSVGFWLQITALADGSSAFPAYWGDNNNDIDTICRLAVSRSGGTYSASIGNSGGSSSSITISPAAFYWVTVKIVKNGTCLMRIYDASGVQVGSEVSVAGQNVSFFYHRLGANSSSNIGFTYIDDYIWDKTDATFPLGP